MHFLVRISILIPVTLITRFVMQLSKIDARIMRNVSEMQQLELKLEPVSAHDYRSILLPLVKSYLRVCIELVGLCATFLSFLWT
jgi:hypothetical protein